MNLLQLQMGQKQKWDKLEKRFRMATCVHMISFSLRLVVANRQSNWRNAASRAHVYSKIGEPFVDDRNKKWNRLEIWRDKCENISTHFLIILKWFLWGVTLINKRVWVSEKWTENRGKMDGDGPLKSQLLWIHWRDRCSLRWY